MTENRDFKNLVRKRAAKTGESYQAARRQVEGQPGRFSARVNATWPHPAGLVLGCHVEQGHLAKGMQVTVLAGDTVVHEGVVASLRVGKGDEDVVTSGDCGVLLDPPFHGYLEGEVEESALEAGALTPVQTVPLPYLVVSSAQATEG